MNEPRTDRLLSHLASGAANAGCPNADVVAAYAEARLFEEEARAVEAHAASCERCRGVLEALRRAPATPRWRRTAAWIALAAAAAVVLAVLVEDPFDWRGGGSLRVDGAALVLAARGDVRSGDRAIAFGDELEAGASLALGPGAAVAVLERDRVRTASRGSERPNVEAPASWVDGPERQRALDAVRAVRRGAVADEPLRLASPVGAVVDPRPALRFEGGSGHVTIVVRGGGATWQQADVAEHEVPFPASLPPLAAGQEWFWQVTSGTESASAPFRLAAAGELSRVEDAIRRAVGSVREAAAGETAERGAAFLEISMLRKADLLGRADEAARRACDRFPDDRVLLEEWALVRRDRGEDDSARELALRARELR